MLQCEQHSNSVQNYKFLNRLEDSGLPFWRHGSLTMKWDFTVSFNKAYLQVLIKHEIRRPQQSLGFNKSFKRWNFFHWISRILKHKICQAWITFHQKRSRTNSQAVAGFPSQLTNTLPLMIHICNKTWNCNTNLQ